jgi:hypothetical protein
MYLPTRSNILKYNFKLTVLDIFVEQYEKK